MTLRRELPPFEAGLARGLRLDATDRQELKTIDWKLWAPWTVDIVVMSAVHSAGRREVEAGVDGAHQLLADGGLLVVKAPRTSIGDEGGMDVVVGGAIPLFGSPITAGEAGRLSQYKDPSLPLQRPADFAIFQKQ